MAATKKSFMFSNEHNVVHPTVAHISVCMGDIIQITYDDTPIWCWSGDIKRLNLMLNYKSNPAPYVFMVLLVMLCIKYKCGLNTVNIITALKQSVS